MGSKIAITFSIFCLEADFYHRLYKNAGRVFLDDFFKVLVGIIFGAVMETNGSYKTPVHGDGSSLLPRIVHGKSSYVTIGYSRIFITQDIGGGPRLRTDRVSFLCQGW